MTHQLIKGSFEKLKTYCENEKYSGWDPFDGLNSKIFQFLPFKYSRICRILWIQFFKQSPINLRKILLVEKGLNPQGLGLFISGYCHLFSVDPKEEYKEIIYKLADKVIALRLEGWSGNCWGYNFDWQARAFYQPKNTPMIVPTAYVTNGLLDAYDLLKDSKLLEVAISVTDFIAKDLNKIEQDDLFAFSYSPLDKTLVFNASLMASQVLARVESYTGSQKYRADASRSVHNCIKYQNDDGSWTYGTKPYHQWIDNFHTGYNLECIADYIKFSGESIDGKVLENGTNYYLDTFFDNSGRYKYYSDTLYPLDINNAAQLIVTLSKLEKFEPNLHLVNNVLDWTIDNMQDKKGYFYYQKHRLYNIKIPYMRWSQAWIFYALSIYLKEINIHE